MNVFICDLHMGVAGGRVWGDKPPHFLEGRGRSITPHTHFLNDFYCDFGYY